MSKSNFLLSDEWETMFSSLPDAEAGKLIKAAFSYHSGQEVNIDDPVVNAIFQMIKAKIDENERKYAEICQKRAEAARAKAEKEEQDETNASKCIQMQANASKAQQETPDNDSDNDSDNDNDSLSSERDRTRVRAIRHKHGEYKHVLLTDDEYKKLCEDFGADIADKAIKAVDEYCETSGKTYKNYNLAIRKWGIDRARGEPRTGSYMDAIYNRVSVVDSWV